LLGKHCKESHGKCAAYSTAGQIFLLIMSALLFIETGLRHVHGLKLFASSLTHLDFGPIWQDYGPFCLNIMLIFFAGPNWECLCAEF